MINADERGVQNVEWVTEIGAGGEVVRVGLLGECGSSKQRDHCLPDPAGLPTAYQIQQPADIAVGWCSVTMPFI